MFRPVNQLHAVGYDFCYYLVFLYFADIILWIRTVYVMVLQPPSYRMPFGICYLVYIHILYFFPDWQPNLSSLNKLVNIYLQVSTIIWVLFFCTVETFFGIVIPIVKCCSSPSRPIDRIIFFFKPPQVNGYWQNRILIFKLKISKNFLIIIIWLDLDRVWILGRCYLKLHRPRYGLRLKILWIPESEIPQSEIGAEHTYRYII